MKFIPIKCVEGKQELHNPEVILGIEDEVNFRTNQPILHRGNKTDMFTTETIEAPRVKYIKCPFYDSNKNLCTARAKRSPVASSPLEHPCIYSGYFSELKIGETAKK